MLDVRLGPLVAATVITEGTWAKISEEDRAAMQAAADAMAKSVNQSAPGLDSEYIDQMKNGGLNVVTLDGQALSDFRAEAERLAATQRGSLVPADAYDAALRARDAFRKKK